MSKTQLIEFVAAKVGLTKADAGRALDAVIEGIVEGLKKEKKVTLVGFGTFATSIRPAKDGINPLTKAPMHVEEKVVAKFKAGSKLKDALN